jgi:hypothetical protein
LSHLRRTALVGNLAKSRRIRDALSGCFGNLPLTRHDRGLALILLQLQTSKGDKPVEGPNRERWEELCRQAAVEKDPKKLLELAAEINRLLQEKEKRLQQQREGTGKNESP